MATTLTNAPSHTGLSVPKNELRAIPAQGAARDHLDRYAAGWVGEPIKYAAIKRAFATLEEAGILERLDQFVFLAQDEEGSLINWVAGKGSAQNLGLSWAAGQGFLGASSQDSGDYATTVNPTEAGSLFALEDAHVSLYMPDVGSEANGNGPIANIGGAVVVLYPRLASGRVGFRLNMDGTHIVEDASHHGQAGLWMLNRGGDTVRLTVNGNLVYSGDHSATALPGGYITIGRTGGPAGGPVDGVYSGWSVGRSLTEEQESILNNVFALLAAAFVDRQ